MANEVSELENKEHRILLNGKQIAVLDNSYILPLNEAKRMVEVSEKIIDLWNSLDSAPLVINPIELRGDKDVRFH